MQVHKGPQNLDITARVGCYEVTGSASLLFNLWLAPTAWRFLRC